ncbi:MAG: NIPSNAP family protein, partial [Mesorhizobium sp.]
AGFDLSGSQRAALDGYEKPSGDNRLSDIVVIKIHHLRHGAEADFASRFKTDAIAVLAAHGARPLAAFVSEHAENCFPRLPVRSGENVFISVAAFDSADAHARHEAVLASSPEWQAFERDAQSCLARSTETLRLSPTSQSLLGR